MAQFPVLTNIKGASIQAPLNIEAQNVWAVDLCDVYDKVACNPYCADEVVRRIYGHSSSAQAVVMSVAETIASREFNIIPTVEDDYWKAVARRKRNEILTAMGRRGGYISYIEAKVRDLLVNKTGSFDQVVYDGNGTIVELGGIGDVIPRPYFQEGNDVYYDANMNEQTRKIKKPSGIWWIDNGYTHRLPSKYYYQTVIGGRGNGAFLVGTSPTEAGRNRIWLSATLEQYMRQVASGTDKSGMLVLNNIAWRQLIAAINKRKESRKNIDPQNKGDDSGNFLVAYNTGDRDASANWVSFRSFPEDVKIVDLMKYTDELVSASYGVKGWRANPDSSGQGGKFGNASRAQQLDAQEPIVQYVSSQIIAFFNSYYLGGMPISFSFVGGTSAEDSMRITNFSSVADSISKLNGVLDQEQLKRAMLYLGVPTTVVKGDGSGVASSSDGVTKTNGHLYNIIKILESSQDDGIVNFDKVDFCVNRISATLKSVFVARDHKSGKFAFGEIDGISTEIKAKLMSFDSVMNGDGIYNLSLFVMKEFDKIRGKYGE